MQLGPPLSGPDRRTELKRRFVLLDRDGTLIAERHYLADPAGVELLPGAAAGLRRLGDMDLGLAVVTNQSGIGRGYFDAACLERVHQSLQCLLEAEGVALDGIYFCPHVPGAGCRCRKPAPGLVEQAARELDFAPQSSFVLGDKVCDIELGNRLGATTFLVRTGYGAQVEAEGTAEPSFIVDDVLAAVPFIKQQLSLD